MKKSLLKTSLICLGVTLLCGMYSFKTPESVDLQQLYQTASISIDTLVTPDGEVTQLIKEVVVESDQGDCDCTVTLYVVYNVSTWWYLKLKNNCPKPVEATCEYIIYSYYDPQTQQFCSSEEGHQTTIPIELGGNCETRVDDGSLDCSVCEPVSVSAHYK